MMKKREKKTEAALASGPAASGRPGAQAQYYTADEVMPYLSDQEKASLRQEVMANLTNELVHAEDLEIAVPRLLRSCWTESKELRRSMNSISSSQLIEAQRALQIVEAAFKQVQDLRALFLKQGELIQGMGADTTSYRQLRKLHFLRDNVTAVIKWSLALKEVRYDNLFALVQQRQFRSMYKRLKSLQNIRRTVITRAGAQYRSFQAVFDPYFSKLDAVLTLFVSEVFDLLEKDSMNVAVARAIDDADYGDDHEDEQNFPEFVALKECIQMCSEEIDKPVLNFRSDGVEQESPITSEKVFDAVATSVAKLWEEQIMIEVVDPFSQISVYVEQMKKVEPLLEALEMTLIPLSYTFSFFGVVVKAIHSEVMHVMEAYLNPDVEVEANGLMEASQFIQWYKEMMTVTNYAQYVDLSTIDELSASFITSAVDGLSAHLVRLCRACAITVCNDPKGPTILPNGYPVTTGPMDMFTVLQQTLGGLSTAIEMPVMREIGKSCAEAISGFLEECKQRSDFDYWEDENQTSPTPKSDEEWQQQRLLFLYAFCNDCSTVESNLDVIELKFASCWDLDEDAQDSPFLKVQDTLPDNAFYYLDEITMQIERVVQDQWNNVFRQGDWYKDTSNPTQLIMNTIGEYIEEEFFTMLQEQRARKLTRQMFVRFISKYISTMMEYYADIIRNAKKYGAESWPSFVDCLVRDIDLIMGIWRDTLQDSAVQLLELGQKALDFLKTLTTVTKAVDLGFMLDNGFLDDFGDCPTFVIRFCIDVRPMQVDKEARDRMMDTWNQRIAFQMRDKNDIPTTGWSQPASFFGSIDRSIADLQYSAGIFRKSVKKKREEDRQKREAEEKEQKRKARKSKREADAVATSKRRQRAPPKTLQNKDVEVASLADILK